MGHAGESGVQLSVGVTVGVTMRLSSSCKSNEEPRGKACHHQHRVVQIARSDRGHLIFSNYFQVWTKSTDSVR